jgi:hypothetical protein
MSISPTLEPPALTLSPSPSKTCAVYSLGSLNDYRDSPTYQIGIVLAEYIGKVSLERLALLAEQPGADVNTPNKEGLTPLMAAASGDSLAPAVRLIHCKADIHAKTTTGETALDLAKKANHVFMQLLLLSESTQPVPKTFISEPMKLRVTDPETTLTASISYDTVEKKGLVHLVKAAHLYALIEIPVSETGRFIPTKSHHISWQMKRDLYYHIALQDSEEATLLKTALIAQEKLKDVVNLIPIFWPVTEGSLLFTFHEYAPFSTQPVQGSSSSLSRLLAKYPISSRRQYKFIETLLVWARHFHKRGIAHTRLNGTNVVASLDYSNSYYLKLGGLYRCAFQDQPMTQVPCSNYLSPDIAESLLSDTPISFKQALALDIWDLGLLSYLIYKKGCLPAAVFSTKPNPSGTERLQELSLLQKSPFLLCETKDPLLGWIRTLLATDWKNRPSIETAITNFLKLKL